MTQLILATRRYSARIDRVWLFLAVALFALAAVDYPQALASIRFTGKALLSVSVFLALSIGVAAYAKASGADTTGNSTMSATTISPRLMAANARYVPTCVR